MFTVGTRLTRVTRALRVRDPDRAIVAAGETVPDWSGGTRLGETLRCFLDRWGQRGMARGAVVVLFSDGWERGDAGPARRAGRAGSHRLAHRVVWVNPHRGKAGYAARCSRASSRRFPHVDDFVAGHSLATFDELMEVVAVREVLPDLMRWWEAGETVGIGTVVATFRSAPRPPGASMLVGPAARRSARSPAAASRAPSTTWPRRSSPAATPVLQRYGVSDDDAFAVGLTCGGILDVYVEKVSQETFPELGEIAADRRGGTPGRRRHRRRAPRPDPSGAAWSSPAGRRTSAAGERLARLRARRRRRHRRRASGCSPRAQRDADLRARRRAARRGHAGVRVGVRAGSSDAGIRRDRLRGGGRPDGRASSATT